MTKRTADASKSADDSGTAARATIPRARADQAPQSHEKRTTDYPDLIDVVQHEDSNTVEFWQFSGVRDATSFVTRATSGATVWIPPSAGDLPWALPRRSHVERWMVQDTDRDYFHALCEWIRRHVFMPDPAYVVFLACWIMHTYAVDLETDSPFVLLLGPPETGKSRTMTACIQVARRGMPTPAVREAAFLRYAELYRATVALDLIAAPEELKRNQDFLAARTTNDGTRATRVLEYQNPADPFKGIQHYRAYGATMLTSNESLVEDWIASRTLTIQCCRADQRFPPIDKGEALILRERGTAFRARALAKKRAGVWPAVPDAPPGRLTDLLSPLVRMLVLADPTQIPVFDQLRAEFQEARLAAVADAMEVELLRHCLDMAAQVEGDPVSLKLKDICGSVNHGLQRGEPPMTPTRASNIFRSTLGIIPRAGTGNYRFVLVSRDRLAKLATRYNLAVPAPGTPVPAPGPSVAVPRPRRRLSADDIDKLTS